MDEKGNEILNLGSFALLPLHVVRLIFSRQSLVADEFTKFQVSENATSEIIVYRSAEGGNVRASS